jgi:predicted transglutaminase-like cysteine proteinase
MKLATAFAILILMYLPARADDPFDVTTVPSRSASLTTTWRDLRAAVARDASLIALCRADPACGSDVALRLIGIVDEARQYQGRKMIGHLNRAINLAIARTHQDVAWLPPLAALGQPGDCKSYAMVKYLALGEAGITMTDRRLVIVRARATPGETHLVVIVRDGERWLILDNRTNVLVDSTAAHSYEPLQQFDANGAWDLE